MTPSPAATYRLPTSGLRHLVLYDAGPVAVKFVGDAVLGCVDSGSALVEAIPRRVLESARTAELRRHGRGRMARVVTRLRMSAYA